MSHGELIDPFPSLAEATTMLDSHKNFSGNYFTMTTGQKLATYKATIHKYNHR